MDKRCKANAAPPSGLGQAPPALSHLQPTAPTIQSVIDVNDDHRTLRSGNPVARGLKTHIVYYKSAPPTLSTAAFFRTPACENRPKSGCGRCFAAGLNRPTKVLHLLLNE